MNTDVYFNFDTFFVGNYCFVYYRIIYILILSQKLVLFSFLLITQKYSEGSCQTCILAHLPQGQQAVTSTAVCGAHTQQTT